MLLWRNKMAIYNSGAFSKLRRGRKRMGTIILAVKSATRTFKVKNEQVKRKYREKLNDCK